MPIFFVNVTLIFSCEKSQFRIYLIANIVNYTQHPCCVNRRMAGNRRALAGNAIHLTCKHKELYYKLSDRIKGTAMNGPDEKPKPASGLAGFQKKFLKGIAHSRKPVVVIGQGGLTDSVLKALDEALEHHELIKVKFIEYKEKNEKQSIVGAIVEETGALLVGIIGHVAILFRPAKDPEKQSIHLPSRSGGHSAPPSGSSNSSRSGRTGRGTKQRRDQDQNRSGNPGRSSRAKRGATK